MNNNNKKKDQFNDTTDAGTAVRWLPSARPRTTSRAPVSDGRAEERLDSFLCFVSFFSKKKFDSSPVAGLQSVQYCTSRAVFRFQTNLRRRRT